MTPFYYREKYIRRRGVRVLMADHCHDVPVAGSHWMKRLVSHSKRSGGGTVFYYHVRGNEKGAAWQTVSSIKRK